MQQSSQTSKLAPKTVNLGIGLHTLRAKVRVMIGLSVIALILFTIMLIWHNNYSYSISKRIVETRQPVISTSKNILLGLSELHQKQQAFMLKKGQDKQLLEEQVQQWEQLVFPALVTLNQIKFRLPKGASPKIIDSLNTLLNTYQQISDNLSKQYAAQVAEIQIHKNDTASLLMTIQQERQLLAETMAVSVRKAQPLLQKIQSQLKKLVSEQQREMRKDYRRINQHNKLVNNLSILGGLGLAGMLVLLGFVLVNRLRNSLQKSVNNLSQLADGRLLEHQTIEQNEFGALTEVANRLAHNLHNASTFAHNIGEGNFDSDFQAVGTQDELGNALIEMRQRLQQVAYEDQQRNWSTEGYAKFGDLLRRYSNEEIRVLGDALLQELVNYLRANQAGMFVYNEEEGQKYLDLRASFAYDRKKFLRKRLKVFDDYAEDLIGQCFLEQESIYLKDIPKDYIYITSGLGDTPPSNLLIVPLKSKETIEGVLEIASLREFTPHEIAFVEQISENVASSINIARINERTRLLLEESQIQKEAMRAQEEEMRQNMEELQATQERMQSVQKEVEESEANLLALINSTDDSLLTIDRQYRAVIINDVLKNRYKATSYEGILEGKSVLDFLGDVRDEWKAYYDRAFRGERYNIIQETSVMGEIGYRHYFFNPISNLEDEIIGLSVFSRDITTQKKKEQQQQTKIDTLQRQNEFLGQMFAFAEFHENGKLILATRQFQEIFKVEFKADSNVNIYDIFNKEKLVFPSQQATNSQTLSDQQGKSWKIHLHHILENGQSHYLLAVT